MRRFAATGCRGDVRTARTPSCRFAENFDVVYDPGLEKLVFFESGSAAAGVTDPLDRLQHARRWSRSPLKAVRLSEDSAADAVAERPVRGDVHADPRSCSRSRTGGVVEKRRPRLQLDEKVHVARRAGRPRAVGAEDADVPRAVAGCGGEDLGALRGRPDRASYASHYRTASASEGHDGSRSLDFAPGMTAGLADMKCRRRG